MHRTLAAVRQIPPMRSYRVARRSFLFGLGGALGLKVLLRNLEASAQGATSPPRLLVMFWPGGTIRYHFEPDGVGAGYTTSRILQPFEAAGLREDLIVLYGLAVRGIDAGCGGGAESGTVMATTGTNLPGTRDNGGEQDDGVAGGPSFDQIFLHNVPELQTPGRGYANAIGDNRVDSNEISARCLSYSYAMRSVDAARISPGCDERGSLMEATPLLPTLRPFDLYTELFGNFMPGGADQEALAQAIARRQSVLDFSLDELERLKTLAPHSESAKIDQHAEIIRQVEQQLGSDPSGLPEGCSVPGVPDAALTGQEGSSFTYNDPETAEPDHPLHRQLGIAHTSLLRAAFQCDLIRVASFQWAPATSHVSFGDMFPPNPGANYQHHPLGSMITDRRQTLDAPPSDEHAAGIIEFLANVHSWYNAETAAILQGFKAATDVFGGALLDHTIVPFVTDKAEMTDSREPLPALILGGRALGMIGGQAQTFSTYRSHNDLWMTIAQAYLKTDDPLARLELESFYKVGVAPIAGLWQPV